MEIEPQTAGIGGERRQESGEDDGGNGAFGDREHQAASFLSFGALSPTRPAESDTAALPLRRTASSTNILGLRAGFGL
jgi:hypothetical protein